MGGIKDSAECSVFGMGVAVTATSHLGMIPILHHLGRRSGHTARIATGIGSTVERTLVIVAVVLVPTGFQQWSHFRHRLAYGTTAKQDIPFVTHPSRGAIVESLGGSYLTLIAFEPRRHVFGHSLDREGVDERVAKQRAHTVVIAEQGKSRPVGTDIESAATERVWSDIYHIGTLQHPLCSLQQQRRVDGLGLQGQAGQDSDNGQKEAFHKTTIFLTMLVPILTR